MLLSINFQDQMSNIYDQLASSQSLLEDQKNTLLIPFKSNLCDSMAEYIPSCEFSNNVDATDNSYEYISGGIVNAVHEFSKSLQSFWSQELQGKASNQTFAEVRAFLMSQTHKTQFTEHFIY